METIRTMMLNLLLIVFLTMLLDLLLPEGNMRGYIKMTMGFFVVLTLLQPIVQIARPEGMLQQWQLSVPTMTEDTALAVQGETYVEQQKQLEQLYTEKMNNQVTSLLLMMTELSQVRVESRVEQQQIQQITVWVPADESVDKQRLQQALSGYYGLAAEQVVIQTEEAENGGVEEYQ